MLRRSAFLTPTTVLLSGVLALGIGVWSIAPIYVDVCEPTQHGAAKQCEKYQITLAILLKVGQVLSHAETWTALGTIAIAAFTFTLWQSTRNLWRVTNDTLRHAENTAERQLRAYIFVEQAEVTPEGNNTLKALVILKNSGQTPAYDVTVWSRVQTTPAGVAPAIDPFEQAALDRVNIGPGGVFIPRADLVIPPGNDHAMPRFKAGQADIYYIGRVEYRDAFDRIWVLDFRLRSAIFEGGRWLMKTTDGGNQEARKQ